MNDSLPPRRVRLEEPGDIHAESHVKRLFAEMAGTYGIVNLLSSLGFAWWWRRQAVHSLVGEARVAGDLMTGGAECLGHLKRRFGSEIAVDLVDWCPVMCQRARAAVARHSHRGCEVIQANALQLPRPAACYDLVTSTFGLKTLARDELLPLAREIRRVLKPGGRFSILEFSVPPNRLLRVFFRLYVKHYVPLLGAVLLGNPDNYRLLWRYTAEFGNCEWLVPVFRAAGFEVECRHHFLGCATQLIGHLPEEFPPESD